MRAAAGVAAAGRDNLALFKEGVGDRNGLGQKAARIVAKIEHDPLQRVAFLAEEIIHRLDKAGGGLFGKGGQADIADAVEYFRTD